MNINKDRLTRIARLTVIALASLLSILALTALAWQDEGHRQITTLLELYNPPEKPPEKDKTPDPNEKNKKKEKSPQQIQAEKIAKRFHLGRHIGIGATTMSHDYVGIVDDTNGTYAVKKFKCLR